jgi:hypothetical protein
VASRVALAGTSAEEADVLPTRILDAQKFDMGSAYESDLTTRVG